MIKILIKNRLQALLKSFLSTVGTKKKGGKPSANVGKVILVSVLLLYLVGTFMFLSISAFLSLGILMLPDNAWMYFSIMIISSFGVLFFFSIFETKSDLFDCKDNDLLLSMPIKPSDIVAARVSVVLIYNYLEELIVVGPAIFIYGILTQDPIGIIGAILVSLFIPLLATALSSAIGYLVALLSKKIRNTTLLSVLFFLVFIGAYMWGMSSLTSALENLDIENIQFPDIPVLRFIGSSALLEPVSFISVLFVCIGIAALAYYVISANYIGIITENRGERRVAYKGEKFTQGSVVWSLARKEIFKLLSSSTYLLNAGMGVLMLLIVSVVAVVNRENLVVLDEIMLDGISINLRGMLHPVMIMVQVVILSTGMISASALSLEGNRLWILKSMPIGAKDVLIAKSIPQILITTPFCVISSVLMIIATDAPLEYLPFFILVPIVANIAFSLFGTVINTAFPKFKYDNEAQVVKQSLAGFIVMFSQMIFSIGVFLLCEIFATAGVGIFGVALALVLYATVAVVLYIILTTVSVRKYEKIES